MRPKLPEVIVFIAMSLCLFFIAWNKAHSAEINISEVQKATVYIGVYDENEKPIQLGSGFFITPSGMLMTNYHVIHRAENIRIWKYGEFTHYPAIVVGIDPLADLALLQIAIPANTSDESYELVKKEPFPHLEFEKDSTTIKVGDEVWAFGNPLSNRFVTTKGIITTDALPGFLSPFVRQVIHDAVLNSGSSGGPLLNADGDVVGINTYMMAPNNTYSGLGSAVRADTALNSMQKMLSVNYVKHQTAAQYPALEIRFVELDDMGTNEVLQKTFPIQKIPNTFGIIVREIEEDGHSYKQGLRDFDTIIAVNGNPTNDRIQLSNALMPFDIGSKVKMLVIRRGVIVAVQFVLTKSNFDYLEHYDASKERSRFKP